MRWRDIFSLHYGHVMKKKEFNNVPSGSSTVEDIIFQFIHVEFLTESSPECHLVNLCYVGGMKWSMAEDNGLCIYCEEGKQVTKVCLKGAVKMTFRVTEHLHF